MTNAGIGIEAVRESFRPAKITTLFVGESAPSGDFFYIGNTAMHRYMQHAVEAYLGKSGNFLESFKGYGWYLDDLVLTPVNHMNRSRRLAECRRVEGGLARRIEGYGPLAIVSLLRSIDEIVKAAAVAAGISAPFYPVPFPGMGLQGRFLDEMARIIPVLPRTA